MNIEQAFIKSQTSDEDVDDIEGLLEGIMERKGIQIPLSLFREVATYKAKKWTICSNQLKKADSCPTGQH